MRDRKPRHPLFWAASAFSLGLWMGVRAWRPPSWWMLEVSAFLIAAFWFLGKRDRLAKVLSLGVWFLLGAFLSQVRGQPAEDPRLRTLADGRPLTLSAHVIREGYPHASGSRSLRQSIDVETEDIASEGETWPVRTGVRLSVYQKLDTAEVAERTALSARHDVEGNAGHDQGAGRTVESPRPHTWLAVTELWYAAAHRGKTSSGAQLPQPRGIRL